MPASRAPVVLSASRRTDLPGWHADALVERVEAARVRLGPGGCHGLVLWTRFPGALLRPPLDSLLVPGYLPAVVVNLTVTGRGGSALEPRVPSTAEALSSIGALVDRLGNPARLRWRFDPLLPGPDLVPSFERLANVFGATGVPTCTVSFPAARSLAGALGPRYQRHNVPEWPGAREDPGCEAKRDALCALAQVASTRGIRLLACSQPWASDLCSLVSPAQCIPLDVLSLDVLSIDVLSLDVLSIDVLSDKTHGSGRLPPRARAPRGKDRTQRKACLCPPSEDLGDYRTDFCRSGCAYCYSTLGGPSPGSRLPWFLRKKK